MSTAKDFGERFAAMLGKHAKRKPTTTDVITDADKVEANVVLVDRLYQSNAEQERKPAFDKAEIARRHRLPEDTPLHGSTPEEAEADAAARAALGQREAGSGDVNRGELAALARLEQKRQTSLRNLFGDGDAA